MKKNTELLKIIFAYLIPIVVWIVLTYTYSPIQFSWRVAAIGFVILFFGSSLIISLLQKKQENIVPALVPAPAPIVVKEEIVPQELLEKIDALQAAVKDREVSLERKETDLNEILLENQEIRKKLVDVNEEFALKEEEAKRKIEALEQEAHQKQQTSTLLENQIHDLRFEIKTLLQLTELEPIRKEEPPPPAIEKPPEKPEKQALPFTAKGLLTRCIDIAQKITAGYHASSLRKVSLDPYAFDLRRLSDALRQESGAVIIVYSPKEERVLFANAETKPLLGVSPEQFAQDFIEFTGPDFAKWRNGVFQLLTKSEVALTLEIATRGGDPLPMRVLLGSIPTGVFRSLVIGVLQPL